jgi:hypothetical protein
MSTFYSQLLEKTFDSPEALMHEEAKERMRRSGAQVAADDALLRSTPIEAVRAACERAMQSDADRMALSEAVSYSDIFTQLHPEFVDNEANAKTIKAALGLFGITTPNQQELEEVYERCKAQGLLHLDKKVLEQQRKDATQRRAAEFVAANTMPTESELYAMDMSELRRRGGGGGGW